MKSRLKKSGIIKGDFHDILTRDEFPSGSFDLVFTSPPYYTARNYGNEALFGNDPDEWGEWCVESIALLAEQVKETGVVWWNTGSGYKDHRKLPVVYKMVVELNERGIFLIDEIPWIKSSSSPKHLRNRPYAGWEHNYIFSKYPDKVIYYKDAVRKPYSEATLSRMKYRMGKLQADKDGDYGDPQVTKISPHPGGASPPNYLILPQDYSKRPHPAPMTPALANWAIRAYTPENGVVLDPMAGIGTTWIECEKLGRYFLGCELFDSYIDIAYLSLNRLKRGDDPYNGLKKEWEMLNENKD